MGRKSVKDSIFDYLRSWDAFGVPITFSFHSQESCQTLLGSFFTLVSRLLVAILLLTEFIAIYKREYTMNKTFKVKDIINHPTTYKMDTSNFNIALRLKTSDPELQADIRRYFRAFVLFEKNHYVNQNLNTYYTDEMEAPRCGPEGFHLSANDKKTFDLREAYCIPPGYYNATISG